MVVSISYRSAFVSLSAGDIVGIALGSLAMLVAAGAVAFYIILRRKDGERPPYEPVALTGDSRITASALSGTSASTILKRG